MTPIKLNRRKTELNAIPVADQVEGQKRGQRKNS